MRCEGADEAYRTGDLAGARTQLQQAVRSAPADLELRIFLAQLLLVLGQWDRAKTHLNVAAELDAKVLAMKYTYCAAIAGEKARGEVFSGRQRPVIAGAPALWMGIYIQALQYTLQGSFDAAAASRQQALEAMPPLAGDVNGQEFEWICDADTRIGPFLELLVNGKYLWAPFQEIRAIASEAPADLYDLVWLPATVTWSTGASSECLLHTRYPGSEHSTDSAIQLGRRTDWAEAGPDNYLGSGQKCFITSNDYELGICDLRAFKVAPVQ